MQKSTCYAKLDERTRSLFDLFRAIGRRDARRMALIASQLLPAATDKRTIEYLYGAALTGFVAQGDYAGARGIFIEYSGAIPEKRRKQGRLRWLESAAASDPARAALGTGAPGR